MNSIFATDILTVSNSPSLIVGSDQRVIFQNAAMTRVLNFDFQGRHFVTALRQPSMIAAIEAAQDKDGPQTAQYATRVDGQDHAFLVTATAIKDHVLVTFEDRTAVQETHALRRDFVANVSHELRTPLTALLGFIETLQGPARDDLKAQAKFLSIMSAEALRMHKLVDDLLSLSRVEETERRKPKDSIALDQLIRSTIETMMPLAEKSQTIVKTDFPPNMPTIKGDDAQLRQVFTNLISNAIKYGATPEGITVSIKAPQYDDALQDNAVSITITDRGDGIAAHHIARLTERFYRVDTHRARDMGGTGLGLAIVKHIVSRHRGRLHISSEIGAGTQVQVLLPVEI